MDLRSIGMFDSGVGGLTVISKLIKLLPKESVTYLADTANVPYGNKTPDEIINLSLNNAAFLLKHNVKMLVVACHTASSYALQALKKNINIPVITIIPEEIEEIIPNNVKKLAVIGTKATIASKIYPRLIRKTYPYVEVMCSPCPTLPSLIEEGFLSHHITKEALRKYLRELKRKGVDALLLGCTHFPLVKTLIKEEMGEHVKLIDPADVVVPRIERVLKQKNLKAPEENIAEYRYFATKAEDRFLQYKEELLKQLLVEEKVCAC
jgi:glutamate racemase